MSSLKVVQILFSGLGGHSSVAFSLVDADHASNWQHSLLFFGTEDLKVEYAIRCSQKNIPYKYIKKKLGADFSSWICVYKQLKQIRPNVILLHSCNLVLVAWLYSLFYSCRLIMVEHTPNQVKRKSEWLWSWLGMLFVKKIVLLTDAYYIELQRKMGIVFKAHKVKVIPNGIDINYFKPNSAPSFVSDVIKVSMVARFSSSKAQALLVEAFALMKSNFPQLKIELVLAGDGETLSSVKLLAEELGISADVFFPGLLNESEIKQLLLQTSIYVHASYGETMSTSLMQALACGLPILASDIPGISNMINGKNGILASNIPDDFSEKLKDLINDSNKRAQLSYNARKYAEQELSQYNMFNKYNSLIK